MGIPYPGGRELSRSAEYARAHLPLSRFTLPRPMLQSKDLNFSFSGLKTAARNLYEIHGHSMTEEEKSDFAREAEDAIVECLIEKTKKAIEEVNPRALIIAGGVAQNKELVRRGTELAENFSLEIFLPSQGLATDNAVMIACAGYIKQCSTPPLSPDTDIRAQGRLSLSESSFSAHK